MSYTLSSTCEWGDTESISEKKFVHHEVDICAFPLVIVPGKLIKASITYCIIYTRCVRLGKWKMAETEKNVKSRKGIKNYSVLLKLFFYDV